MNKNVLYIGLMLAITIMAIAVYASADTMAVNLMSPATANITSDPTPTFTFNFTDFENDTADCSIVINGTKLDDNSSTDNNTATPITLTTALGEGNYSWNVNCTLDSADNDSDADWYIMIDTTAPTINHITPVAGNATTDNTTDVTFNFTDAISSQADCTLYINSTAYNTTADISNGTGTLLTSDTELATGIYSWWVNCTDRGQNIGMGIAREVIIDQIAPTVYSYSPANGSTTVDIVSSVQVVFNDTRMNSTTVNTSTFIVERSDNGTDVAGSIATTNNLYFIFYPTSNLAYSTAYNVTLVNDTITDLAGNKMVSNYTWRFTTVATFLGGGGGTGITTPTTTIIDISPGSSAEVSMFRGGSVGFDVIDEPHTLKLISLVGSTATLRFSSDPVTFAISVGGYKYLDVNGDNHNDVKVTFDRLVSGKAYFTVHMLSLAREAATTTTTTPSTTTTTTTPSAAAEPTADVVAPEEAPMDWTYVGIAVLVIIILVGGAAWYSASKK